LTSSFSGLKLAAKAWGKESGKKILGVHGWLDNAATWDFIAPHLAQNGFYVVSLDLPGHGKSEHRPKGCFYHSLDYVTDMLGALDALKWDQCVLLGHSMGASLCTMLAPLIPERIQAMVLVEGFGPFCSPPDQLVPEMRKSLKSWHVLADKKPTTYPNIETAVEKLLQNNSAWSSNMTMSLRSGQALVERSTSQPASDGSIYFLHDIRLRVGSLYRFSEEQAEAMIKQIKAPTLCIYGEKGLKHFSDRYHKRKHLVEKLEELMVEDAGHHLHLDCPEKIISRIDDFLLKYSNPS